MKKSFYLLFAFVLCICLISGCKDKNQKENETSLRTSSPDATQSTQSTEVEPTPTDAETSSPSSSQKQMDKETEAPTEQQTKDEPLFSEKDAKSFISTAYNKYEIYRGRECNINSPESIFPKKSGEAYVLPYFLDNYFYSSGKSINIHDDTDGILSDSEAAYLDKAYGFPHFSAVKISTVQSVFNEIFGKNTYRLSGGIENNCTQSGYYLMLGGRGGDGLSIFNDYRISNIQISNEIARVTVSESWSVMDDNGDFHDVSAKTTYILGITNGSVYLQDVIFN